MSRSRKKLAGKANLFNYGVSKERIEFCNKQWIHTGEHSHSMKWMKEEHHRQARQFDRNLEQYIDEDDIPDSRMDGRGSLKFDYW